MCAFSKEPTAAILTFEGILLVATMAGLVIGRRSDPRILTRFLTIAVGGPLVTKGGSARFARPGATLSSAGGPSLGSLGRGAAADGEEKCVNICNQKALTFVPRDASTEMLTESDWFPSPLI